MGVGAQFHMSSARPANYRDTCQQHASRPSDRLQDLQPNSQGRLSGVTDALYWSVGLQGLQLNIQDRPSDCSV